MLTALIVLLRSVGLMCRGHGAVALANLALHQQLAALTRTKNDRSFACAIGSFGRPSPKRLRGLRRDILDKTVMRALHISDHVECDVASLNVRSIERNGVGDAC